MNSSHKYRIIQIKKLMNYFRFIRPWAFIGISIVFITSTIIAIKINPQQEYKILNIILSSLSWGFLASGAHSINNIFDLKIDRINKPFRALPSKKISIKEAWIITLTLYISSIILALFNKTEFLILFLVGIISTLTYSCPPFYFKKRGFLANINIAISRGLLLILAGWVIVGNLNEPTPWLIGGISSIYLLGAASTKDIADIKGDIKNKCSTLPSRYGIEKTAKIIAPFLVLPFLIIPLGVHYKILITPTLPLTLLSLYGLYIASLIVKKKENHTTIEKNHISWKHAYILYMIFHLSISTIYIIHY